MRFYSSLFKQVLMLVIFTYLHCCKTKINQTKVHPDGNNPASIKAGDICTVIEGDGKFGVVKVLVINDTLAHLKIYKNKYDERPVSLDLKTLSIGSMYDSDGFGVGHTPVVKTDFINWQPAIIANEPVEEEELEGYRIWQEQ